MDDIDVTPYIRDFEDNDISGAFEDFKFSDCKNHALKFSKNTIQIFELVVLDNDSTCLSAMLDEYSKANNNQCLSETPHSMFRL
jgi:hypothetical protein